MSTAAESYSFHCTTAGSPASHAVLFLHGFMGSGEDWRPTMDALAQDFYCIAPDLPGHGTTRVQGGDELYDMENAASGLSRMLRESGIQRCAVVGYSMGGRLALYLAAKQILPISALVLESSSPGLRSEEERAARRKHDEGLAHQLEMTPFDDFLTRWYEQPLFASLKRHSDFESVLERRKKNNPAGLALSLRRMGTGAQPSLWDDLGVMTIPVVLLAGEYDAKFVGLGREMNALLPGSLLHIVEGAGHTIHVENEARYKELLRDVLRQYSRAQPNSFSQSTD